MMATKVQKIFAKFIRTNNPNERAALKHKLKGVKTSEVSYTKEGKRYTIHGNIPWKQPASKQIKRRLRHKPKQRSAPNTSPHRKERVKSTSAPQKQTLEEWLRQESDDDARSVIKRRNKGLF